MNIQNDQDNLDSTQQATLQFVAGQCPFAGGSAVYEARALLGDGIYYDDRTLCQTGAQPLEKPEDDKTQQPLAFRLYPNPAAGLFILELQEEAAEEGEVWVMNALGRQVFREKFKAGATSILVDLTGVPAGTYYLTLRTKSQAASRLIINLN